jgi:hypothetical protein
MPGPNMPEFKSAQQSR